MRGLFITFEGGEGTGKSTQVNLLAERMRQDGGGEVVVTREPGGSEGAEEIRHLLLSGKFRSMGAVVETLMFAAAREDHLQQVIRPALLRGATVICDRFIDSTRVYQGVVGCVSEALLDALETNIVAEAMPDLTVILDIPTEVSLKRMRERQASGTTQIDRFESEPTNIHEKIRGGFLRIANSQPKRCKVVDASLSADAVHQKVWALIDKALQEQV